MKSASRSILLQRKLSPSLHCVSTVSAASGRYRLRSTGSAAYVLPRTRTKFGERGFFYSGPAAWNTLPSDLHDITDTSTFRKRLKNVPFDRAYNWLLLALLDESYSGALQSTNLALIDWLIDWLIISEVDRVIRYTTLLLLKICATVWILPLTFGHCSAICRVFRE